MMDGDKAGGSGVYWEHGRERNDHGEVFIFLITAGLALVNAAQLATYSTED